MQAGQGNCVWGCTIPWHACVQRGRACRLGRVGCIKLGGRDGIAQVEGTATGGKVGALCFMCPWCAHKWEGGQKGMLVSGRGGDPLCQERGGGTLSPLHLWHVRKGVAGGRARWGT